MEHFKMFIAGKFCEAKSGKTMQALDPGTGQPVATVPCGGPADADKAVRAVRKAFDSGTWSGLSPEDRSAIIMDWADRIEMQVPRLAMYESMNSGALISSVGGSIWTAVRSMRNLAWYAATQFPWREEVPMSGGIVGFGRNVTIREPIGVCVGIVPWNMPIMMALWKISHAIAMGNTIVIKPASDTPLSALILGETIAESKIPKGVINIVTGPGGELGEALAS
ncbi:MAG: aldehyde dehydrogenase family protein, partial [Chloroflexi bacterium]|nr:aldehyde dehydrogenase family protein [Chloroflexota bacterium]